VESPQTPIARVVLLGASNVVLGFCPAVRAARERLGAPLEVFAASGHGRSYGTTGRVFGRALPAISTCGLWSALAERPSLATFAVVTDVGNDLAFGFEPQEIEEWVDTCLAQLAGHGAQTVLTGLPLDALQRLPAWEFRFFSRLFFPGRSFERDDVLDAARDLDARLQRLARERKLVDLAPRPEWYGHDPIHVLRGARKEAWRTYMAPWEPKTRPKRAVPFDARWKQRGALIAAERTLFGRPAGRAQPCANLADGTRFFLY
jgi:hypothetical protein